MKRKCRLCHKKKSDVRKRLNPFNREVHDDYTKQLLCDNCTDELMDEIQNYEDYK